MSDQANMAVAFSDTIHNLESQTWEALKEDGKALVPFLSKDCVMLFPMGLIVSATSDPNLKEIMTSEAFVPWKSYEMSHIQVTPLGADAAVITYKVKAMRPAIDAPDDGIPFRALISSTWRRDPEVGQWLMTSHQQTPYSDIL